MITVREQRQPFVGGFGFGARARLLGYFIRADYAWGVEDMVVNNRSRFSEPRFLIPVLRDKYPIK